MLDQISAALSTFHMCAHLSFVVTTHYPHIRHLPCYAVLGATDTLAHALAAVRGYKLGAMMVVWHLFKGYVQRYRSNTLMNVLDCLAHGQASTPLHIEGFALYFALRFLDLVW